METITKNELVTILEKLYRSYNDSLPGTEKARKQILTAWWDVLNDLPLDAIQKGIQYQQIYNPTFMPLPWKSESKPKTKPTPTHPPHQPKPGKHTSTPNPPTTTATGPPHNTTQPYNKQSPNYPQPNSTPCPPETENSS